MTNAIQLKSHESLLNSDARCNVCIEMEEELLKRIIVMIIFLFMIIFCSCSPNESTTYDDEISELETKIEELESRIDDLESKIEDMDYTITMLESYSYSY